MHFRSLQITAFRNYPELTLALSPGINAFTGPNGAGKTNLLEAVHYLALTRGFQSDPGATQHGENFFLLKAQVAGAAFAQQLMCNFQKGSGKRILYDGEPLPRLSDHYGRVPLVAVLPEDTEIVTGPPKSRRKWLNMLLAQLDRHYLELLIGYQKNLEARNALLKTALEHRHPPDRSLAEVYELQLAQAGHQLQQQRAQFLNSFAPHFAAAYRALAPDTEEVARLNYQPNLAEGTTLAAWEAAFREHWDRDRLLGRTEAGLHRDEIRFTLQDRAVRKFGSQGQRKTYLLALRLAEYNALSAAAPHAPLLLLDDVFDRLDASRVAALAAWVHNAVAGQVFVTDTGKARLQTAFSADSSTEIQYFKVNNGEINR